MRRCGRAEQEDEQEARDLRQTGREETRSNPLHPGPLVAPRKVKAPFAPLSELDSCGVREMASLMTPELRLCLHKPQGRYTLGRPLPNH